MSRTYYTLRLPMEGGEHKIIGDELDTFDEAYDIMCQMYMASRDEEQPIRCGIWKTDENDYGGHENSMTQQVWAA